MHIERTGYIGNGQYIFTTAFLDESDTLPSPNPDVNNADFILKKQSHPTTLLHITDPDFVRSILNSGIKMPNPDDEIGNTDFGVGIYAIDSKNPKSIENLKTYLTDTSLEYVAVITFSYEKERYVCIYGDDHIGYHFLKSNVAPTDIICTKTYAVSDILWDDAILQSI